ncbi:MAG: dihydroneopterin aldolase [Legionella sp.]|nr:MAG: dihydroneopterin aldolase [Legionella sp.]
MDTLHIADLKIATQIGVYAWEQRIKQTLVFDLSIPLDLSHCQDNLANTIDYAQLCQHITEFVASRSFQLLETAAEQVLTLIQTHYGIEHLTLKVSKPFAVKNAGKIQIILER